MGNKLWVVLAIAIGIALTVSTGQRQERESLASFSPGIEQIAPTWQETIRLQRNSLPCVLDSGLVAEKLMEYEGPFVEDTTNEPVSGVAALMLYNSGSRDISFGMVAVDQGEQVLHFFITWLPAGERALVLEHERTAYSKASVTGCRSEGLRWENFYTVDGAIDVSQSTHRELTAINCCTRTVNGIRLRYKMYQEEGDYYLGGITYSAYVGMLLPGESRAVSPAYHTAGSVKVVAVLTQ